MTSRNTDSDFSDTEDTCLKTLLKQRNVLDRQSDGPNNFKTALLCLLSLTLGVIQTTSLAILIPESQALGLSTTQASWILAAWPASALLVLLIQPAMNRLNDVLYFLLAGVLNSAGFCSFYLSVTVPHYYLYIAVLARFTCGTTLFLINNKTAQGITEHLRGDVSKSSFLWEAFNSAGLACGAYIGYWLDAKIGFPLSMAVSGGATMVTVVMLSCCYPPNEGRVSESTDISTRDTYLLYVSSHMITYCWCPLICIGGCMVFTEGIITEFYLKDFSKSLLFGGVLLGTGGILYSISAMVMGLLREKWPCLKIAGLLAGMLGCAVCLPLIGPWIISPPGVYKLVLSVTAFTLLNICSSAIQVNSLTLSADALSPQLDGQEAMSISLNGFNVAYNLGAFVGPIIGGALLTKFSFGEVFAMGAPFFVVGAMIVAAFHSSSMSDRKNVTKIMDCKKY